MRKYMRGTIVVFFTLLISSFFACSSNPGTSVSTTPPTTKAGRQYLANGNININAMTTLDDAFNVTATMKNASVVGIFNTVGGGANLIEVYIMDDAAYVNFQKGRKQGILFDSGNVSKGDVNQAIKVGGKYHLLFTNYTTSSLSKAEVVNAMIYLTWGN